MPNASVRCRVIVSDSPSASAVMSISCCRFPRPQGARITAVDGIVHLREAAISIRRAPQLRVTLSVSAQPTGSIEGSKKRGRRGRSSRWRFLPRLHCPRRPRRAHGGMLAVCGRAEMSSGKPAQVLSARFVVRYAPPSMAYSTRSRSLISEMPVHVRLALSSLSIRPAKWTRRARWAAFLSITATAVRPLGAPSCSRCPVPRTYRYGQRPRTEESSVRKPLAVVLGGKLCHAQAGRVRFAAGFDNVLHMARACVGGVSSADPHNTQVMVCVPGTRTVSRG